MNISAEKREPRVFYASIGHKLFNSLLIHQLMRVSGIVTILLITTFQVLMATPGKGQSMATEEVTIGLKQESLASCLRQIEEQTSLRFYYRKSDIKSFDNLNLPIGRRTVQETLTELLQNTFFSFRQIDGNILLKRENQQISYEINGRLLDNGRQPVIFANVSIMRNSSDKISQFTQTDTSGYFKLVVHERGDYLINISQIGMDSLSVALTLGDLKIVKLPDILLFTSSKQLKVVAIVGKKPFIEQRIDRTVLNVENSILASGKTALDVLSIAPGVIVDNQNVNIRLNDKSGVMVMINGRRNILSAADLANMLRNMSSDQISSIEIITNPSAKYDASGTAGIIDIKLKKNKFFGTNGSASATVSQGLVPYGPKDLIRESLNLNLNHRTDKLNMYINLNPNSNADYSQTTLHRNVDLGESLTTFDGFNTNPMKGTGLSVRTGIDYLASPRTTYGVLFEGEANNEKINGDSKTIINEINSGIETQNSLFQNSNTQSPRRNLTTNFNIKHDFDDNGTTLTFDATYSGYSNAKDQNFNTNYIGNFGNLTDNTVHRNETDVNINIYTAKADLTVPVSESLKLEGGLKSDYVQTKNNSQFDQLISGAWENIPTQSNYFVYKENVNAAYVSLNQNWTNWAIQAGLRAEQTYSNGQSLTDQQTSKKHYLSFFPSIFINQTINKDNFIRYSYSRRIGRPNYQQLNPFIFYIDKYTIDQGNPFLNPQFTDSYQVSYTYKNSITSSIGYSQTKDVILQLTEQNDSTKVVSAIQGNLGSYKGFYINISFPVTVCHWWSMQNQFSANHDAYRDKLSSNTEFNNSKFKYSFSTYNTFKLSDTWNAELSFNFISPRTFGIERATTANYSTNAGIQKSLFDRRARLTFNVSDIFLTSQYTGFVQYKNVDLSVINKWASRRASLTFSYNFGKQTVKSPRERSTGAETLKSRSN
ncbi:TonB-dependent receptor domain-containing protein [Pedobacter sp. JCM 36344]|uniref:TonB-dependent receptor domain-containing protein n=1 Tax=Pedobacter sp. JCM 36344 TaxID=3374280 RepID=UPI003979FFA8